MSEVHSFARKMIDYAVKLANNSHILMEGNEQLRGLAKEARPKLASSAMQAAKPYLRNLALGTAAAAPVVAGGAYLINKANRKAEQFRDDSLKKALGVGVGLAAAHGIARSVPRRHIVTHRSDPRQQQQMKMASSGDTLTKLAACIYLEDKFEKLADGDQKTSLRDQNNLRFAELLETLLGD